jgi:uncharacterized protein YbjT (DUF2867 family)
MILVAGATGQVGSHVCGLLSNQGHTVRALVRPTSDPARVEALQALGIETVEGDLRDEISLRRACNGVQSVISTATATGVPRAGDTVLNVDGTGQMALADAAQAAGVGHYVFISFSGGLDEDCPLRTSKRAVEAHLRQSGMRWTILRPTAFMEIWLSPAVGFDVPQRHATIYGAGGAPISYVSLFDVARFCVEAVRRPEARNAVLEIGGPDPITPLQAVRLAEEITGTAIAVTHVPVEALRAQRDGATDPLQQSFAALMIGLANGDVVDMRQTAATFGVQLRSVRQFMEEAYGQLRVEA